MSAYPLVVHTDPSTLTRKEFTPGNDVRWCPGCVDYSILAAMQKLAPTLGIPRENFVFVSGIGCAARFPYYMETYGLHSVHGRAPAVATGLKLTRPELSVWIMSGDGDSLAIGGNHFMHVLRRNVDVKLILFNNRIYGLTKGQYSPTSELGKRTKSTPDGSTDYPMDPVSLAISTGATFVARVLGNDNAGMQEIFRQAAEHKGAAMVEVYQTCVIFNDGAFDYLTDAATKEEQRLVLEHGKPLRFGKDLAKGIMMDKNGRPTVVNVADVGEDKLIVYDSGSETLAYTMSRLNVPEFPTPMGVFFKTQKPTYDELTRGQIDQAKSRKTMTAKAILEKGDVWTVG